MGVLEDGTCGVIWLPHGARRRTGARESTGPVPRIFLRAPIPPEETLAGTAPWIRAPPGPKGCSEHLPRPAVQLVLLRCSTASPST